MSVSAEIDQLAAEVRKRAHAQPAPAKKAARRVAADFARDLPGVPPEHVGAVLLRAAVFASAVFQENPGASARELANLFGAAGERLYHHAGQTECDGA